MSWETIDLYEKSTGRTVEVHIVPVLNGGPCPMPRHVLARTCYCNPVLTIPPGGSVPVLTHFMEQ